MNLVLGKKAEHGISVLFLFLAIILVTTIISGVIIIQSHKLAGEGGKMVDKVEQGYKNLQVTEITGFDGRDQEIEALNVDVKNFGKGAPLDLKDLSLSIGEEDSRSILRYREDGKLTPGNDGYNTWVEEHFENMTNFETTIDYDNVAVGIEPDVANPFADIDGDTIVDTIASAGGVVCSGNTTHVCFILSSTGETVYLPLINTSNGALVDVDGAGVPFDVVKEPIIGADGTSYGYFTLIGVSDGVGQIGVSDSGNVVGSYYTQPELVDADLDDDGLDDYVAINNTHVLFFVSSLSHTINIALGVNLSEPGAHTLAVDEQVTNGHRYATVRINGTTNTVGELDSGVTFEVDPYRSGSGYYTIEYLRRGDHPLDGYFVSGDVVRFYAETYQSVGINEVIRVQFYYKDLDTAVKYAYTGDTMPNKERVTFFPRI